MIQEVEDDKADMRPDRAEAMQQLMAEKTRTEEERADLEMEFKKQRAEANERFAALQAEKDAQKMLEDKLASMQAKVMRGGTNLLDQEERLREEQRRQADQLAKIAAQEAEASRRMKELQEIQTITGDENLGSQRAILANKISHFFGLKGCALALQCWDKHTDVYELNFFVTNIMFNLVFYSP